MLSQQTIVSIKQEIKAGVKSLAAIAREYETTRATISAIANNKRHADVEPRLTAGAEVDVRPVDPTDARVIDLASENDSLRAELALARRTAKAASKEHGLFRAMVEELHCIKPMKALPMDCLRRTTKSKIQESLVMHVSDGHHDAVVTAEETGGLEEYNFDVSCRRAERLVDTTLDFALNALSNYQFEDLTVLLNGDFTSGCIHDAEPRSHYRNQFKNCLAIGQLYGLMLRDLAPYFPSINVVCLSGNHGRMTTKKDHHGAQQNWDYLIAKLAETHTRAIPNISFTIPNAYSINVDIRGSVFNVSHGDDVRGHQGIPFYGLLRRHGNLMKLAQVQRIEPIRYSCVGHHHIAASLQDGNGELLANGAWLGTDAYAYNSFSGYREPSQLIHGVHDRHGVTWKLNVQMRGEDDLQGPKRYRIEV
jgi:hypothetical protein